ncbi:MAG: TonB-dependent receptor [Acidobacteriaceae bacterium]|nr:TonB-dependent receptor [Acidobacteriaceae bacterium]
MHTTTNSSGLYFITSIPPGTYELTIEKSGFRTAKIENIPLTTGLAATEDAVLEVGSVRQAVEVSASAVQIEAQSSDMNSVITTRAVADLPILGRDPLSFSAVVPGVIPTQGQQTANNPGVIGRITTSQISGGLAQQNGVLIDGAESRGTTESGLAYSLPIEAVAELRLETATFNAEYGRVAGGVGILSTKSGTDQIHGTAWDFLRNDVLNANSWTNDRNGISKTLFQRNAFGGNIGGPVMIPKIYNGKNKIEVHRHRLNRLRGLLPRARRQSWHTVHHVGPQNRFAVSVLGIVIRRTHGNRVPQHPLRMLDLPRHLHGKLIACDELICDCHQLVKLFHELCSVRDVFVPDVAQ